MKTILLLNIYWEINGLTEKTSAFLLFSGSLILLLFLNLLLVPGDNRSAVVFSFRPIDFIAFWEL